METDSILHYLQISHFPLHAIVRVEYAKIACLNFLFQSIYLDEELIVGGLFQILEQGRVGGKCRYGKKVSENKLLLGQDAYFSDDRSRTI
jgi:hypothetical protein